MYVLTFSNSERAPRERVWRPSHAAHLHGAYLTVIIRAARGDQAVFARKLVKPSRHLRRMRGIIRLYPVKPVNFEPADQVVYHPFGDENERMGEHGQPLPPL